MKKLWTSILILVVFCLLCACGEKNETEQSTAKPIDIVPAQEKQMIVKEEQEVNAETEEDVKEMFGYRFTLPMKVEAESASDGALCDMASCELFIYRRNVLDFSSWDETVEQCKDKLSSALFSATRFRASEQTATADEPFTNANGVEMMRVTGELSGSAGTKPYIAYYYVTDENYLRFMICLNYENEADAAEVIDYVAERLEKA